MVLSGVEGDWNRAFPSQEWGVVRAENGRPMREIVDFDRKITGAKLAVVKSKPFQTRRGSPGLL